MPIKKSCSAKTVVLAEESRQKKQKKTSKSSLCVLLLHHQQQNVTPVRKTKQPKPKSLSTCSPEEGRADQNQSELIK